MFPQSCLRAALTALAIVKLCLLTVLPACAAEPSPPTQPADPRTSIAARFGKWLSEFERTGAARDLWQCYHAAFGPLAPWNRDWPERRSEFLDAKIKLVRRVCAVADVNLKASDHPGYAPEFREYRRMPPGPRRDELQERFGKAHDEYTNKREILRIRRVAIEDLGGFLVRCYEGAERNAALRLVEQGLSDAATLAEVRAAMEQR